MLPNCSQGQAQLRTQQLILISGGWPIRDRFIRLGPVYCFELGANHKRCGAKPHIFLDRFPAPAPRGKYKCWSSPLIKVSIYCWTTLTMSLTSSWIPSNDKTRLSQTRTSWILEVWVAHLETVLQKVGCFALTLCLLGAPAQTPNIDDFLVRGVCF